MSSKELLETLEKMGVVGKSASSSVPEDLVPRLRASGGKVTKPAKPRQVMEPPPKPRPKAKPKKAAPKAAAAPVEEAAPPAESEAVAPAPEVPAPAAVPAAVPAPAVAAAPAVPEGPVLQIVRGSTPADLRGEDQPVSRRDREDPVPVGGDGHRDHVALRRSAADPRIRARISRGDRRPRRRAPSGGARTRGRGRRVQARAALPGGHRHGTRRPRQDQAPRRHPYDRRGLGRVRRHHPAHRRVPGPCQRPGDHVHRHAWSRGLHRDASAGRPDHRHRGARRRRRRRRDAADRRGARPRESGGRARDRGGQQDRQGGSGSEPRAHPDGGARARAVGVGRRHGVRRCLREDERRTSRACWRPC